MTVVENPFSMARLSRGRASEMLAAGADDRLDELAVRVFVAALHQLAQRLPPVRGLIIRGVEVERTKRIVSRTHDVDGVEAAARRLDGVAQGPRFGRAH